MITLTVRSALKVAYSPFLNRAALTGNRALDQMTDDLRVLAANAGCVVDADLELLGWLPAQIGKHGVSAARAARAKSDRNRP
jgi:hypothetical protein